MSSQDLSMHDPQTHICHEHAQWLEKLESWRAEHKRAMAQLSRIQAALLNHDAEIEEYIVQIQRHERFIEEQARMGARQPQGNGHAQGEGSVFGNEAEHERRHRLVRIEIKYAEATHERTIETLQQTIERLREIRSDFRDRKDSGFPSANFNGRDLVEQAGYESFPASDPPSFNPGRA